MILSQQFLIYVAIGLTCAGIDIGLMRIFISQDINYLIAATFGFIAGLILNFSLHTWITFSARYSHRALLRYIVVVFFNYVLTLLFISLFQKLFGMPILGKIFSLPLVAVNGFLLIKYWVHKKKTNSF